MYVIRATSDADQQFLTDMLYEALFVPPGHEPFPRSVLESEDIRQYVEEFGTRKGDLGFVAVFDEERIGAAWVRLINGYGYVDDDTPELTLAVRPEWQGRGVGTALLERILAAVPRVSLSSDSRNPATSLYRRFGFTPLAQDKTSLTMLRRA